jgi:hypothetical protein
MMPISRRIDEALSGVGLGALSWPAKVLVALVVATGFSLTWLLVVIDFFSDDPSSTVGLVLIVPLVYVPLAVLLIAGVDWAARRVLRRVDRG